MEDKDYFRKVGYAGSSVLPQGQKPSLGTLPGVGGGRDTLQ